MKYTPNYELKKPEQDDFYNVEDFNENADIIDQALKAHDDALTTKETPEGAQEKADAALNSAKQYTDQEVGEVAQELAAHKAESALRVAIATEGAVRSLMGQPPRGNTLDATNFEITAGTSDIGYNLDAPVVRFQSNISLPAGTGYPAAYQFQSRINPDNDSYFANAWFTTQDNAVGKSHHVNVVSYISASVDRDAGAGATGDIWGYWAVVNNAGFKANGIGMEVNATNTDENYLDTARNGIPDKFMYGHQIIPADSTKHCTRAISIVGQGSIGWDTGINVLGFVNNGIYINSAIPYADPPTNSVAATRNALRFGKDITNLIVCEIDTGGRRLVFTRAGSGEATQWVYKNALTANNMIKFDISNDSVQLGNNVLVVTQTQVGLMLEGKFRPITVGANDSGGTGYRMLRVPNA